MKLSQSKHITVQRGCRVRKGVGDLRSRHNLQVVGGVAQLGDNQVPGGQSRHMTEAQTEYLSAEQTNQSKA